MRRVSVWVGVFVLAVSNSTMAQEVNVPHAFSSGDTISASEMNDNFDALEAGVNANADAINTNSNAIGTLGAFFDVADNAANSTTSATFVTVPGLSRTITLDQPATVVVTANGHGIISSGFAVVVSIAIDGDVLHSNGTYEFGMGFTSSSAAYVPITALASADLAAGTYTIDTRFRAQGGGTANFNYPAMAITVFP